MLRILVVDDSPVDRRLVGGILQEEPTFQVDYATDGADALAQIEIAPPDGVITDMIMPEIDGLELVRTIRSRFASVPVILMTSQGTEKIAVEALESGAASYVPKRELADELVNTMRHVLALSTQQRTHERLMSGLTRSQAAFRLPNDATLVTSLVSHLQDNVEYMELCDDADRIRFGVAIEEALVNAMYHGNLEVESSLKETDHEAYDVLVRNRREQSPYQNRRIHVETDFTRSKATVTIRDEGPGFDPHSLPDPTDPENLDKVTGRGVLLMRTFMDAIEFNENGNQVTMTKLRKAGSNGAP